MNFNNIFSNPAKKNMCERQRLVKLLSSVPSDHDENAVLNFFAAHSDDLHCAKTRYPNIFHKSISSIWRWANVDTLKHLEYSCSFKWRVQVIKAYQERTGKDGSDATDPDKVAKLRAELVEMRAQRKRDAQQFFEPLSRLAKNFDEDPHLFISYCLANYQRIQDTTSEFPDFFHNDEYSTATINWRDFRRVYRSLTSKAQLDYILEHNRDAIFYCNMYSNSTELLDLMIHCGELEIVRGMLESGATTGPGSIESAIQLLPSRIYESLEGGFIDTEEVARLQAQTKCTLQMSTQNDRRAYEIIDMLMHPRYMFRYEAGKHDSPVLFTLIECASRCSLDVLFKLIECCSIEWKMYKSGGNLIDVLLYRLDLTFRERLDAIRRLVKEYGVDLSFHWGRLIMWPGWFSDDEVSALLDWSEPYYNAHGHNWIRFEAVKYAAYRPGLVVLLTSLKPRRYEFHSDVFDCIGSRWLYCERTGKMKIVVSSEHKIDLITRVHLAGIQRLNERSLVNALACGDLKTAKFLHQHCQAGQYMTRGAINNLLPSMLTMESYRKAPAGMRKQVEDEYLGCLRWLGREFTATMSLVIQDMARDEWLSHRINYAIPDDRARQYLVQTFLPRQIKGN